MYYQVFGLDFENSDKPALRNVGLNNFSDFNSASDAIEDGKFDTSYPCYTILAIVPGKIKLPEEFKSGNNEDLFQIEEDIQLLLNKR